MVAVLAIIFTCSIATATQISSRNAHFYGTPFPPKVRALRLSKIDFTSIT